MDGVTDRPTRPLEIGCRDEGCTNEEKRVLRQQSSNSTGEACSTKADSTSAAHSTSKVSATKAATTKATAVETATAETSTTVEASSSTAGVTTTKSSSSTATVPSRPRGRTECKQSEANYAEYSFCFHASRSLPLCFITMAHSRDFVMPPKMY